MRLGIMGGTFDPVHHGHLFIAEEARVRFRLERVVFVPTGRPPHKPGRAIADARHRFAMVEIATEPNPAFDCSSIEVDRAGLSYTVDTLETIRDQYPGAELFTIIGVDAIAEVQTWKRPDEVMEQTTFIAAARPGFDVRTLKERLPAAYLARILLLESTALSISSTDIRMRVANDEPIRYLTPDAVADYIARQHLYRVDEPVRAPVSV